MQFWSFFSFDWDQKRTLVGRPVSSHLRKCVCFFGWNLELILSSSEARSSDSGLPCVLFLHCKVKWCKSTQISLKLYTLLITFIALSSFVLSKFQTLYFSYTWATCVITRRQKFLATGNEPFYKILRDKVNRKLKRCCRVYYETKVKDLRDQIPLDWWQELKLLFGTGKRTRRDLTSII